MFNFKGGRFITGKIKDLVGDKYGRLTVIEYAGKAKDGHMTIWKCKCDCGKETIVIGRNLKNGTSKSCGCTNIKHGYHGTRLYNVWKHMRQRCFNQNDKNYSDYGGRGITVCQEWQDEFIDFHDWAINNGYKDTLSIDRTNNDGNYEPNNCRWVTQKQQCNNKRNTTFLQFGGKTKSLSEWADLYKINLRILEGRIKRKWPVGKALTQSTKRINNSLRHSFMG